MKYFFQNACRSCSVCVIAQLDLAAAIATEVDLSSIVSVKGDIGRSVVNKKRSNVM